MRAPIWNEDRWSKSYDLASDQVKQLITLSTGIIALAVSFAKDVFSSANPWIKVILVLALLCYLASMMSGTKAMGGLTGCMNASIEKKAGLRIYHDTIADRCKWQIWWFLAGTILVVALVTIELSFLNRRRNPILRL